MCKLLKLKSNYSNSLELSQQNIWCGGVFQHQHCWELLAKGENQKLIYFKSVVVLFFPSPQTLHPLLPVPREDSSHYPALAMPLGSRNLNSPLSPCSPGLVSTQQAWEVTKQFHFAHLSAQAHRQPWHTSTLLQMSKLTGFGEVI